MSSTLTMQRSKMGFSDYIQALEQERRKIQVFPKELPLSSRSSPSPYTTSSSSIHHHCLSSTPPPSHQSLSPAASALHFRNTKLLRALSTTHQQTLTYSTTLFFTLHVKQQQPHKYSLSASLLPEILLPDSIPSHSAITTTSQQPSITLKPKTESGIDLKPKQGVVSKSAAQIVHEQHGNLAPAARVAMTRRVRPLVSLNPYMGSWTIKVSVTNKGSYQGSEEDRSFPQC
ncbi:hypothetical protein RYX36_016730 [Vicia faba]